MAPTPKPTPKPTNKPTPAPTRVGWICGFVKLDTDNDDKPEEPIEGVTVSLFDKHGKFLEDTITNKKGRYCFDGFVEGVYIIKETNPDDVFDVSDTDGANDNTIKTSVGPDNDFKSDGNNFLDEPARSIGGKVLEDADDDGDGDVGLKDVKIELLDEDGKVLATTKTGADGSFLFEGLEPGTYSIRETQPAGLVSVSDSDGGPNLDLIKDVSVGSGDVPNLFFINRVPSGVPSSSPSGTPSSSPSGTPSSSPSDVPSMAPTPKPTPKPTNKPTPKPTNKPTSKPTVAECDHWTQLYPTESFDDEDSIKRWREGKRACDGEFECILGPFVKGDKPTYKTFTDIPKDATFVKIEFTLLEIDNVVADQLYIIVAGVKINIGPIAYNLWETEKRGEKHGITWRRKPMVEDVDLGFGPENDAKHKIAIYVEPKHYKDGKLFIQLEPKISSHEGGIGYDRFKFFARPACLHRNLAGQSSLRSSRRNAEMDMIIAEMDADTDKPIVLNHNNAEEDMLFMDIDV